MKNNPIKFFVDDIKTDVQAVKEIGKRIKNEEPILSQHQKEQLTKGWGDAFKENWILFLLIALAFSCGWFVAGRVYENKCNQHIIDTFYPWYNNPSSPNYIAEDGDLDPLQACVRQQMSIKDGYLDNYTIFAS